MAGFKFNLEPLIGIRRRAEQQKQRAVAELEQRRHGLEDALRRHQAYITDSKRSVRDQLLGLVDLGQLRGHAATSLTLMKEANRLVVELAGVVQRLDLARGELAEATARRKAVELLRQRRFDAWKRLLEKAEMAALDEVAARVGHKGWSP